MLVKLGIAKTTQAEAGDPVDGGGKGADKPSEQGKATPGLGHSASPKRSRSRDKRERDGKRRHADGQDARPGDAESGKHKRKSPVVRSCIHGPPGL